MRVMDLNERDMLALSWIGSMWAVNKEVLTVLLTRLSRSESSRLCDRSVRQVMERWIKLGLLATDGERLPRALGRQWFTPSKKGMQACGLDYPVWPLTPTQLRHKHLSAVARLAWEADHSEPWVSEREIRAVNEWRHYPDGMVATENGTWWFEIELSLKKPEYMAARLRARLPEDCRAIYYLTEARQVNRLRGLIERNGSGRAVPISVGELPVVHGVRDI